MASGNTTVQSLADSLPTVINGARIVREYEGTFMRTTETHTLGEGDGTAWNEIDLAALSAQRVTENTVLDNPQQFSDTLFSITPQVIGIQTIITDRTMRRVSKKTTAKMGALAQNAIQRLKNDDYLTALDGATTSIAGAGTTLTSGHMSAAAAQARYGGGNEPSTGTLFGVLQSYQIKDIQDEIAAGIGTYIISRGLTEDVFRKGFMGTIWGINLFRDDNITIDSSTDAKGGVHPKEAVVMVQGHSPRNETRRRPEIGGGADEMFMYDEYEYGERSAGNWLLEIYSDATAPTS